jgi:hypothetical protein
MSATGVPDRSIQGRAKSRSWCPPNTDREIFEISVGGGSRIKYAKPAPQAKTSFFQSGNALKNDENWSKYVILIVFTVLRQNTYGKSRSVGSFTHYRPTELKIWYLGGTNNGTSRGPAETLISN